MADPRFFQEGFDKVLIHVIEECGEVLAAAGKTLRFGPESYNPLLPEEDRELNIDWLLREITDLQWALKRLDQIVEKDFTR